MRGLTWRMGLPALSATVSREHAEDVWVLISSRLEL